MVALNKNYDVISSRKINVTLLGPNIDHKHSLISMLNGHCHHLSWIPDSHSSLQVSPVTPWHRIIRYFDKLTYTRNKRFLSETCQHLDKHRTDLIVAYWGTNPLADIAAIKRLRPKIKIVLMVLCYPLALNSLGIRRQNWMMRRASKGLDGILYSNIAMASYFKTEVMNNEFNSLPYLILPPCWPKSFQSLERDSRVIGNANLIYAGRTDLSGKTVHSGDDIRAMMQSILDAGIELHHVHSPETNDGHPYRKPFSPLSQKELIHNMAAHDASLIYYNVDSCQCPDRFDLTVPDRLITSVAAGVPIAVPLRGFSGVKAYLHDYPAVIQFNTVSDLKSQLYDRAKVKYARNAAWEFRNNYTAEGQGGGLANFLVSIVDQTVLR